jgi:hypothetical protein
MDPESQEAGRQASALEDRLFEALESKLALGIVPDGAHLLHLVPIPLERPSRTWGSSRRAPERTAGPPLGDSVIPLKRPVGGRGPNLQHQMSASW